MLQLAVVIIFVHIALIGFIWSIFKKVKPYLDKVGSHLDQSEGRYKEENERWELRVKGITERLDTNQLATEAVNNGIELLRGSNFNSTIYFNSDGEAMNLNFERWSVEIDKDFNDSLQSTDKKHLRRVTNKNPEPADESGFLKIYIRKDKVMFDKFTFDLNKADKKHENYPILEYAKFLLSTSQINLKQLTFEFTAGLAEALRETPTVYHRNASLMFLDTLISHVRPMYLKYAEEKKLNEKVENDTVSEGPADLEKLGKLGMTEDGKVYQAEKAEVILFSGDKISDFDKPQNIIYQGSVLNCPFDILEVNAEVSAKIRKKHVDQDCMIIYVPEFLTGGMDKADGSDKSVQPIPFILNGKPFMSDCKLISYERIVELAGLKVENAPTVTFSYKNGKGGILSAGENVEVSADLIINAMNTGNA